MSNPSQHVHPPADLVRITEEHLRSMVKADLVEVAVDLLEECHVLRADRDDARGRRRAALDETAVAQQRLAAAEARVHALEECNDHERKRVDSLTGAVMPEDVHGGLTGYELDETLDALRNVIKGARR